MTDTTELQRLTRIRRLGRQIAASLPGDLDLEQAFLVQENVRELSVGARKRMRAPTSSKAVLRAELEAALANYRGPVTLCPPAAPPEPDRGDDLSLVDDDGFDEDPVPERAGRVSRG
jgi:hypothetical protein